MNKKQFVSKLATLRPSATFLTVEGYRNEFSELADYSLIFHMSYEKALERSAAMLNGFVPTNDLEIIAKDELLASFSKSLSNIRDNGGETDDTYSKYFDKHGNVIKGIKLHTRTNTLFLYGLVNMKRVILPGLYPTDDTRRPLTKVKDRLRQATPVGKFRQFKMLPWTVSSIKVENLTLVPPGC